MSLLFVPVTDMRIPRSRSPTRFRPVPMPLSEIRRGQPPRAAL
jgi:hypothetical protein